MIVGFDGSRAFLKERTGTENYSYQLLLHLAKIDKDNSYIVYLRPGSVVNKKEWPSNFGFKVLKYPRLWTQFGLARATFKDPLNVLFVPSHTLPLIRKKSLKTVMTVHDLGAEYLPAMHQVKQRLYLGFITKLQLKTATKLIAVSKATKEDLINKVGVDSEKISVVYEAANTKVFKPFRIDPNRSSLKHLGLVSGKYFFFLGSVQPRKNLQRLIEAFAKLDPSLKLVIAGGDGWLSSKIYSESERLGIKDRVLFLGRINDSMAISLYSSAIALTFPSLFEGFGLPILEAFALNCPVLTSNISSMPEVAGDAAVLVDPYSVESITQGLKKVMDETVSRKLVSLGKEQLKKFSWEKSAKQTLEVLKSVS